MKHKINKDDFKIDKRNFKRKLGAVLIGDAISAFGLVFFLKPNHMIAGGIEGISVLIEYLTGFPLGLLVLLFNLPLLVLSVFLLDKEFSIFSIISIFVLSGYISLYELIIPKGFAITDNVVLACVYGGLLRGIGIGLLFRNGASTGGLDIVAAIMKTYYNMALGNVMIALNCFIIGLSAIIFDVDRALYTFIALMMTYKIIDRVQMGVGKQKQVFIISEHEIEIAENIQKQLSRGVTFLRGEGAYKHHQMRIMYVVCTPRELVYVKKIVEKIDANAFVTISDTSEIVGKGFRKIEI